MLKLFLFANLKDTVSHILYCLNCGYCIKESCPGNERGEIHSALLRLMSGRSHVFVHQWHFFHVQAEVLELFCLQEMKKMFHFCHRINEAEHYGKRAKFCFYKVMVTTGGKKHELLYKKCLLAEVMSLWEQDFLLALQMNSIFLFSSISAILFSLLCSLYVTPLFNAQSQ